MAGELRMSKSLSLMALNGFLSVLAACAFILFIYYIVKNKSEGYYWLRPAIAFLVLWVGDMTLRAPIWWTRQLVNIGIPSYPSDTTLVVGGCITATAYLCIIRLFSRQSWGNIPWIVSFILASLFTAGSLLFTYWETH